MRLRSLAPAGVLLVAAALYGWRIWAEGWSNTYYTAAVRSMSLSPRNFLFGAFDPLGLITVDKPPLALWPQVVFASIFGYHGWSMLLPQVLEGVLAVFLLRRAVRRWAGENVALLAALLLAITPVMTAINRTNNPDTMMVLLLVAAAGAFTRSIDAVTPSGRTGWLLLTGVFLGVSFVAKMLQAWVVLPAFAVAFLFGVPGSWWRRIADLLAAGLALLVSAGWWVALVELWPAPKPFFGASQDGSVLDLIVGYNGLGRLLGQSTLAGSAGGASGTVIGNAFSGSAGPLRLFDEQTGGQISWLLPLCLLVLGLLVLVAVTSSGVLRQRSAPTPPAWRAGWLLWGGWLLITALVFSFTQGISHPYYSAELAPAVAAVAAVGLATLWRCYREPGNAAWPLLPLAVAGTAAWAWVLVSRDLAWNGWLRYPVLVSAGLAVPALLATRSGTARRFRHAAGALGLLSVLLAPAVWSAATALGASAVLMRANNPIAGSATPLLRGWAAAAHGAPGVPLGGVSPQQMGAALTAMRTGRDGQLSGKQQRMLAYAIANSGDTPIVLAVEDGVLGGAASYLMNTGKTVVGLGGFGGGDPVPTADQLAQWVSHGQVRFVLKPPGPAAGKPGTSGWFGGGMPALFATPASIARADWIEKHCAEVPPQAYGAPTQHTAPSPLSAPPELYDCQPPAAH
ncbi:MAG: glycosyltransferase family 39 protein [Pseudonocardiales bacterium]|nr:glycosyltransferase family 39 protein [Pseudonocardiales bacterium]